MTLDQLKDLKELLRVNQFDAKKAFLPASYLFVAVPNPAVSNSRSTRDLRRRVDTVKANSKNFDKEHAKAVRDLLDDGDISQELTFSIQDCAGFNLIDVVVTSPDQFALENGAPL